ncbi:MAG: hypothetical protein IJB53_03450 [Mailhella sp.]|nr:hypothetical protein [Mailhella sp.]
MDILATYAPIVIGATGMEEIAQNVRMIVLTCTGSVPLDRAFAHGPAYIDAPSPFEVARLISRLTSAIEKYEPRVKVESIYLEDSSTMDAMQGKIVPRIKISVKEGIV